MSQNCTSKIIKKKIRICEGEGDGNKMTGWFSIVANAQTFKCPTCYFSGSQTTSTLRALTDDNLTSNNIDVHETL
jgi:hypothetical protein